MSETLRVQVRVKDAVKDFIIHGAIADHDRSQAAFCAILLEEAMLARQVEELARQVEETMLARQAKE